MAQPTISVGTLIDKSWHYYRSHFGVLMSVSGWLLLAAAVNIIALAFYPSASVILSERAYTGSEIFGMALLLFSNFVFTPLLGVWITATLVRLIDATISGRETSLKAILAEGKKRFLPFLWVSVLFALVILATLLFLAPGFLFLLVGNSLSGFGTSIAMIGTLLLMIGILLATIAAILWGVRFFFATYTLLVDGHRGRAALKQSYRLVHGNFWNIVIRLVLPKALFFLVFAFGLFIILTVANLITAGAAGLNIDLQVRLNTVVTGVFVLLQTVLITPLILITDYLLYKDLTRS